MCVMAEVGGVMRRGRRQFAEVREGLSQSQRVFRQSHGLQLESPDNMA